MRPAGMAARATAVIIDGLLALTVLGTVVAVLTGQAHHSGGNASFNLHGWPAFLWAVLAVGYWIVCERLWGMTIGKRLFSIRVQRSDGGKPSWGQSIVRNLFRLVDGFPYLIPFLLGFAVAKSNDERARIGDKMAGTIVVGN
jgi:uncharacterized RDD family membrane protein YckC